MQDWRNTDFNRNMLNSERYQYQRQNGYNKINHWPLNSSPLTPNNLMK